MGSDYQDGLLTQFRDLVRATGRGCAKIEATQRGTLFSWGGHSLLNSHQSWEEAGQGLEDLLTVLASSLHPVPKPSLGGGRKRVKREKYKG